MFFQKLTSPVAAEGKVDDDLHVMEVVLWAVIANVELSYWPDTKEDDALNSTANQQTLVMRSGNLLSPAGGNGVA